MMPRYFVGSYIPDPAAGRIIREKFKAWTEHEARKNAVRRLRRMDWAGFRYSWCAQTIPSMALGASGSSAISTSTLTLG